MLVEFSVSNFRSFTDKETLTMEASNPQENALYSVIKTGFKQTPYLYKTGAILGANASGKSNIIKAIQFFQDLIENSTQYDNFHNGKEFAFKRPYFKLDPKYKNKNTEFNIVFIAPFEKTEGLYSYEIAISDTSIEKEVLKVTPKTTGTEILLIDRHEKYIYKNANIDLSNDQAILDNHLFFTYINRKTKNKYFYDIFIQLVMKNRVFLTNKFSKSITSDLILNNHLSDITKEKVIQFMQDAEINIANIEIEKQERDWSQIHDDKFLEMIKDTSFAYKFDLTSFKNDMNGLPVPFDFDEDESTGTQILYSLSAVILHALNDGETLIVDELDSNMHPRLVQYIISRFEDETENPKNAQLIISTHSSNVLDLGLNPEQFFITELRDDFSTEIYSIGDFKSSQVESDPYNKLSSDYIQGIFGGVPIFNLNTSKGNSHV